MAVNTFDELVEKAQNTRLTDNTGGVIFEHKGFVVADDSGDLLDEDGDLMSLTNVTQIFDTEIEADAEIEEQELVDVRALPFSMTIQIGAA